MRQREFQKVLEKYRKGRCTPEEQALIEKWFSAMGSWEDPSLEESEKTEIRNRSWGLIHRHMGRSKTSDPGRQAKKRAIPISPRTVWAVAACISIVVASAVMILRDPGINKDLQSDFNAEKRVISNDTKKEMQVRLADGSLVLLKPASKLVISQPFTNGQRIVALEGEAFFDVWRDTLHPFSVYTGEVITKVLGTSFTVSAFADDENITVSVTEGKVSVMTKQDENSANTTLHETILTPNQKAVYNRSNNIVSRGLINEPVPVLPADVVRRMHFEAAPVSEIFTALEEVYGVDITFDKEVFSSCILTTSIGEGNIYNRLDMICKAIDARFDLQGDQIVISGPGCSNQ